jgi:hypothetical protein
MPLDDFRAVFLPYCLKKQKDGRYVVLNREYKPVGFYTTTWVKYEEHPVFVKIKGLTKASAAKLSDKGETNLEELFLYNDATNPVSSKANMQLYLAKLEILARLSVG